MPDTKRYDLLIVGTGPAGLTAATYALRQGLKVAVFGDTPGGCLYMLAELDNYPGIMTGMPGAQFGTTLFSQAQDLGAFLPMVRLARLDHEKGGFLGIDINDQQYFGHAAILAPGLIPHRPDIPGSEKNGVYFCSTCDGPLFRNSQAVLTVVGGGNEAGRHCLTLSSYASKINLICSEIKPTMEKALFDSIQTRSNINIMLGSRVVAFKGLDQIDTVETVSSDGERMQTATNGVFFATGRKPDLSILKLAVTTSPRGYIETDNRLMTSFPGLFAAGDVRDTDLRRVVTACADGARAATHAASFVTGSRQSVD